LRPDHLENAKRVSLLEECARRGLKLRPVSGGREWVGPCPICQDGDDRFAINIAKGVWNCRRCDQGGDIIDLVEALDGCSTADAIRLLAGVANGPRRPFVGALDGPGPSLPPDDDEARQRAALRVWGEAKPIWGTLAELYLVRTRRLRLDGLDMDDALRFHPNAPFGGNGERHPCLIALARGITDNEPRAIYRTALTEHAQKIARKMLGPTKGTAVKLTADEHITDALCVGEGLEICIAAANFGYAPIWSLGSALAVRRLPVLDAVQTLTVITDNDAPDQKGHRAGQDAAFVTIVRWRWAGRDAHKVMPEIEGQDLADLIGGEDA
jgi:hypothetical protein